MGEPRAVKKSPNQPQSPHVSLCSSFLAAKTLAAAPPRVARVGRERGRHRLLPRIGRRGAAWRATMPQSPPIAKSRQVGSASVAALPSPRRGLLSPAPALAPRCSLPLPASSPSPFLDVINRRPTVVAEQPAAASDTQAASTGEEGNHWRLPICNFSSLASDTQAASTGEERNHWRLPICNFSSLEYTK